MDINYFDTNYDNYQLQPISLHQSNNSIEEQNLIDFSYPDIKDDCFYEKIRNKKEFSDLKYNNFNDENKNGYKKSQIFCYI